MVEPSSAKDPSPLQEQKSPNKIQPTKSQEVAKKQFDKREEKKKAKKLRAEKAKGKENISQNVVLPKIYTITSKEILALHFSQDSISETTKEGLPLNELVANMKDKGWKSGVQLEVVRMPNNTLVTLNNRRLWAAQKVAQERLDFSIKLAEYSHDMPAPEKLQRGIHAEYTRAQGAKKINFLAYEILPNTYGECTIIRIQTRKETSDLGFSEIPEVRKKPTTENKDTRQIIP